MPKCWFVLLRFWLRVDHLLVRLYETRYLCDFCRPEQLVREIRCCEGTFEELHSAGAPPDGVKLLSIPRNSIHRVPRLKHLSRAH